MKLWASIPFEGQVRGGNRHDSAALAMKFWHSTGLHETFLGYRYVVEKAMLFSRFGRMNFLVRFSEPLSAERQMTIRLASQVGFLPEDDEKLWEGASGMISIVRVRVEADGSHRLFKP